MQKTEETKQDAPSFLQRFNAMRQELGLSHADIARLTGYKVVSIKAMAGAESRALLLAVAVYERMKARRPAKTAK